MSGRKRSRSRSPDPRQVLVADELYGRTLLVVQRLQGLRLLQRGLTRILLQVVVADEELGRKALLACERAAAETLVQQLLLIRIHGEQRTHLHQCLTDCQSSERVARLLTEVQQMEAFKRLLIAEEEDMAVLVIARSVEADRRMTVEFEELHTRREYLRMNREWRVQHGACFLRNVECLGRGAVQDAESVAFRCIVDDCAAPVPWLLARWRALCALLQREDSLRLHRYATFSGDRCRAATPWLVALEAQGRRDIIVECNTARCLMNWLHNNGVGCLAALRAAYTDYDTRLAALDRAGLLSQFTDFVSQVRTVQHRILVSPCEKDCQIAFSHNLGLLVGRCAANFRVVLVPAVAHLYQAMFTCTRKYPLGSEWWYWLRARLQKSTNSKNFCLRDLIDKCTPDSYTVADPLPKECLRGRCRHLAYVLYVSDDTIASYFEV